ncbi:MAG TPA: hypothetical protein VKF80_07335, partial [Candidatus Eisenbacteria bacterium]|nr:hypothetical protein [Candidatus Eisenbacteria bacterium]
RESRKTILVFSRMRAGTDAWPTNIDRVSSDVPAQALLRSRMENEWFYFTSLGLRGRDFDSENLFET